MNQSNANDRSEPIANNATISQSYSPRMPQVNHPAPRWRDYVLPVLYPTGSVSVMPHFLRRMIFWILLALILVGGVLVPYVLPDTLRDAETDYPPGTRLRDCRDDSCPWLVVIPEGRFMMGSTIIEPIRFMNEKPRHEVTISYRFAIMETEVTRGQFASFVKETKYISQGKCNYIDGNSQIGLSWKNPDFEQTDQHPVVCVNWNDAQAYAKWLSERTRQHYRLPSESEWEYAARAGTQTQFWFGDKGDDPCKYDNVRSINRGSNRVDCSDGYVYTVPVKSFQPNPYGLYDIHGNVSEWTQDCWHDNYLGAPNDGSGWGSDCNKDRRVLRGGSWGGGLHSSFRAAEMLRTQDSIVGFRLVRNLIPSNSTPLPRKEMSKE